MIPPSPLLPPLPFHRHLPLSAIRHFFTYIFLFPFSSFLTFCFPFFRFTVTFFIFLLRPRFLLLFSFILLFGFSYLVLSSLIYNLSLLLTTSMCISKVLDYSHKNRNLKSTNNYLIFPPTSSYKKGKKREKEIKK